MRDPEILTASGARELPFKPGDPMYEFFRDDLRAGEDRLALPPC